MLVVAAIKLLIPFAIIAAILAGICLILFIIYYLITKKKTNNSWKYTIVNGKLKISLNPPAKVETITSNPTNDPASSISPYNELTKDIYNKVIADLSSGYETQKAIAERYGIEPSKVSRIKRGRLKKTNLPPYET